MTNLVILLCRSPGQTDCWIHALPITMWSGSVALYYYNSHSCRFLSRQSMTVDNWQRKFVKITRGTRSGLQIQKLQIPDCLHVVLPVPARKVRHIWKFSNVPMLFVKSCARREVERDIDNPVAFPGVHIYSEQRIFPKDVASTSQNY